MEESWQIRAVMNDSGLEIEKGIGLKDGHEGGWNETREDGK